MYKKPVAAPEWVGAPDGARVHSLSGCISPYFTDYIPHWQHNGFWLFNSPVALDVVVAAAGLNASKFDLLYFETELRQFNETSSAWEPFAPDDSFQTEVEPPAHAQLLGFEIVCFSCGTSPECAPVTCCGLADRVAINSSCLLPSPSAAQDAIESGLCSNTEPGPFRIVSVSLARSALLPPAA